MKKGWWFGVAVAVALAGLGSNASAGLSAEFPLPSARAGGPARAATTLAKAKKKKRPGGSSSGKSDGDDSAPGGDDDAGSKSSAASSSSGDEASSKEDELLGSPKKKAPPARDDGDASGGGGGGGDDGDGAGARKSGGKSVETVSASASSEDSGAASPASALEFGIGARALFRNFNWTSDGAKAGLGPYSLTPGPETGLWFEFYPAAFGTSGFAANVGIFGSFNYGFGVATTLANGNDVGTKFRDFQGGLKVRIPLGTFVPNVSVAYGQQLFEIAQQQTMADLPQLAYQFVRPALGTRVFFTPTIALDVTAGYLLVLDPGSGADHVKSSRYFPKTKSYGVDASASVAFRLSGAVGARAGVDWRQYGLSFSPDSSTRAVAGAVDRYITAWAGIEVVLDGEGAAAGGDDEPVKPSKRKRRHAEPKPDDSSDTDDSSSKSEDE